MSGDGSPPTDGTDVTAGPPLCMDVSALDELMPMHIVVAADGRIQRVARTLRKLRPDCALVGGNLFEHFVFRRPRDPATVADLLGTEGGRLSLAFREGGHGHFKAVGVSLGAGSGAFLNLSFGLSLVDAVQAFDLTAADFAGTDLAVEMLYLVEAKSAALQESKKLISRLQGARVAAEEQAFTDTLTGLKNRRAMDHVLARLAGDLVPFGLLHLDLDHFKQVNDTHGHAAGDEVLQAVARILVEETRQGDIAARVGGDEFILIFRDLADVPTLEQIACRIIARLEEPIPHGSTRLRISGSIGLTTSERSSAGSVEAMLQAADLALYSSKHAGRGCVTVAPASTDLVASDGPEGEASDSSAFLWLNRCEPCKRPRPNR